MHWLIPYHVLVKYELVVTLTIISKECVLLITYLPLANGKTYRPHLKYQEYYIILT